MKSDSLMLLLIAAALGFMDPGPTTPTLRVERLLLAALREGCLS